MNKPDLSKMRVEIKWAEDMWQQIKDATMTTVGKDKGGYPNHDWKLKLLMAEHSPIRLGFVILKIYDAPQFVHGHLVRHSNGVVPFVSSLRSDRNNYNEVPDRNTLQSATYYFNFQALINVARKRLCNCASYETQKAFKMIKDEIVKFEPEAASRMVRECVYRNGLCAMSMGFYEGVNLSLAYCNNCGHEELNMDICPNCGSSDLTKIERMNGYLSYSRVHGDTRLNDAKMAEIADRKSM